MRSGSALPIRLKVPLLVSGLLLLGAATTSWIGYRELRRSALATSQERLVAVADQLTALLTASASRMAGQTARLASDGRVADYLRSGAAPPSAELLALLDSTASEGGSLDAVEIWDPPGAPRLSAGTSLPPLDRETANALLEELSQEDSVLVTPFRVVNDSVVYETIAPVIADGELLGYAAFRRRIAGSSGTAGQLRDLIGPGVAFFVGSPDRNVWTDLAGPVAGPPVSVPAADTLLEYSRDRGWQLASVRRVSSAPWVLLVEFPRAPILAGARGVGARLALITAGLAAVGLAVTWILLGRLLEPIGDLAHAARTVAKGAHPPRIVPRRGDELGQLGEAFNSMADRIQGEQERLHEQVVRRTAELRTLNEELEAFSYSVSHDLRAPLRSINGFCQALLEDASDDLDEVGRGHLQRVRAASQRMADLIDDLLDLSRVSRAELRREPVDVTALANQIVSDLLHDRPRPVEVVIAPNLRASADPRLLRLALENLIGNAWKFTRDQPIARIEVGAEDGSGQPTFFVRDNGAGFDMAYADKLFTPFQRLHSPAEFDGTGIGLATVRRVVHRHGGEVWAEAAVNRGATVRFTLDPTDNDSKATA